MVIGLYSSAGMAINLRVPRESSNWSDHRPANLVSSSTPIGVARLCLKDSSRGKGVCQPNNEATAALKGTTQAHWPFLSWFHRLTGGPHFRDQRPARVHAPIAPLTSKPCELDTVVFGPALRIFPAGKTLTSRWERVSANNQPKQGSKVISTGCQGF